MKAIVLHGHGDIDQLKYEQLPDPTPAPDEALVRIKATSVNRIDFFVRGGYPNFQFDFPHVPGADIAGVVEEVGPEVRQFKKGDRVLAWPLVACGDCEACRKDRRGLCLNWQYFGMHRKGSYADYVNVPEASLLPLPDDVSFKEAAALPVAGLTAFHALDSVGQLKKGETALLWGGSGGLGTFAVQIAKELGARVVTTVGRDAKRAALEGLGAGLVLNHHTDDVAAAVREYTDGAGVDLVLDAVGAQTFPVGFELLKKGGRLLLCGKLTGMDVSLSLHLTYLRHVSIHGLYLGERDELATLLDWVRAGRVKPVIDQTFALKDAPEAQRRMAAGEQLGKLVLLP